jgi:hypothetical protein
MMAIEMPAAIKPYSIAVAPDSFFKKATNLYQIALPATHLRRYVEFVTSVQVLDLTHVCDAIIPAQRRVT